MITSFLVIIFFYLGDSFFFAEGDKKNYSAKKKKILTNKRSYSSNGNTIMPMIFRFYATHSQNFPYINVFSKILGFFRHKSLPVRKFPGLLQTFFNFRVLYNLNKKTLWKKFQGYSLLKIENIHNVLKMIKVRQK